MIIINTTMINAVDLDQYTIIDESSMINDDFGNFSKPICQLIFRFLIFDEHWISATNLNLSACRTSMEQTLRDYYTTNK